MKKLIPVFVAACALSASAAESPLWLRSPSVSPDGSSVAFSYKGDIFVVPVSGGLARQITSSPAYDADPFWSPAGDRLAFASDRLGSLDVFVIPAKGGTATRLTTSSAAERPLGWLNDSTVLFGASGLIEPASAMGPFSSAVYSVDASGSRRPRLFRGIPMTALSVAPDGRIAYQDRKGYEDVLRKHERSSGTADIWIMDGDSFSKVTSFNGHDQSPVWIDPATVAYVSERDGTLNVWSSALDGSGARQLTSFSNHPVRSLSRAANGLMVFSWNGELYSLVPGADPARIDVEIVSDDYDRDLAKSILRNGATWIAPSPDGEEIAFVLRGDIYVTSVKYNTTKRVTNTPSQERVVNYSPDGKTLVYDSERNGLWQLFTASVANPGEKGFAYATEIVEKPLYAGDKAAQRPAFSPDGKKVAFWEDRSELRVIDIDSHRVHTALPKKFNYSYSDGDIDFRWSPDSRWFLTDYIGVGGWNNSDIALVKADGSEVIDLTESGYSDSNPRWAMDGRAVTYTTGRYGMKSHGSWGNQSDVVVMFLDGDAWDEFNRTEEEAALAKDADKKKNDKDKDKDKDKDNDKDKAKGKDKEKAKPDDDVKPLVFDLDNRHFRTRRLTSLSSSMGDYWMNNDGSRLYYIATAPDGSSNLMERDLRKGETKVLIPSFGRGGFEPDKKGENLYALSGSGISKIALPAGKKENVDFQADYDRHPSLEREYIYDHMLQQVEDKFYDASIHGIDWKMYGENYRRFLPHINNNYDFAALLSEILGELNASHTGGRYRKPSPAMETASLGVFFDESWQGNGLRIAEIIDRSPLSSRKAAVAPGDIVLAIDGVEILPGAEFNSLLEGKAGRPVTLTVATEGGAVRPVSVKPLWADELSNLLYLRWVERNERYVDSISNGRIAYVHVRGMDSPSFREVYSKLLGKYRNHDAVVVDTRWNGGGWLHNDLVQLLSGREYVRYSPRGQFIGHDPFSQWTKPSAMLVNEGNYSDAHGTPYVYQTLGVGDVVGAPVPGTMTAVWWETQIDPTLVFGIPQVTSLDNGGEPLENKQLNPDILIYNDPADVIAGRDAQLEGAVRSLLLKVDGR